MYLVKHLALPVCLIVIATHCTCLEGQCHNDLSDGLSSYPDHQTSPEEGIESENKIEKRVRSIMYDYTTEQKGMPLIRRFIPYARVSTFPLTPGQWRNWRVKQINVKPQNRQPRIKPHGHLMKWKWLIYKR